MMYLKGITPDSRYRNSRGVFACAPTIHLNKCSSTDSKIFTSFSLIACHVERGDFQFFFRIFVAFGLNSPMTIRFILVCFKTFVSVWKTLHLNPILRGQPNFNLYTNNMNFYFGIFYVFLIGFS